MDWGLRKFSSGRKESPQSGPVKSTVRSADKVTKKARRGKVGTSFSDSPTKGGLRRRENET